MGEKRSKFRFLVGNPERKKERKKRFGIRGCTWENNTKCILEI
jgi:hypothetical protein